MHVSSRVAALTLLVIAVSVNDVRAGVLAFDFSTSAHNVIGYTSDQDFGFEFSPITDLLVDTLLIWDSGGDDFASFDADVAIWNVANPGTPVVAGAITTAGSPTRTSASSSLGTWRVVDVPDTLLMSGATYRLAADGFFGSDYGRTTSLTPLLNGITLSSPNPGVESSPSGSWVPGPEYPNSAGTSIWATASFTYTAYTPAVPEPSSMLLMASSVLCLALRRRVMPIRKSFSAS